MAEVAICCFEDYIIKDTMASSLLVLGSLILMEACCHIIRKVKQPYRGLWGKKQRPPSNSFVSHLGNAPSSPGKPSNDSSLVNILDKTSEETLVQNLSAKLLPNASHTEILKY